MYSNFVRMMQALSLGMLKNYQSKLLRKYESKGINKRK